MALIKNLLTGRALEVGKIKLGGVGEERKSSTGTPFRLPKKFAHFVVTTMERGADTNFVRDEAVHALVGDKPTELDAVLMFHSVEENLHTEMVQYRGKKKAISCDGETVTSVGTGETTGCVKLAGGNCNCKPYTRFPVQLMAHPELEAYHVFRSTGWHTAANLQGGLERLYAHFGTLLGLPVRLKCMPQTVNYQEGDKAKQSKAMVVGVVLAAGFEEVAERLLERHRVLDSTRDQVRLLAATTAADMDETDAGDAEGFAGEYFPDEGAEASVETQATMDGMKEELGVGQPEPEGEGAPVVDADVIEDDDDAVEPEPIPTDPAEAPGAPVPPASAAEPEDDAPPPPSQADEKPASAGAINALSRLVDQVRTADVMTPALETQAEEAMVAGTEAAVNAARSALSQAMADAPQGEAAPPEQEQLNF